MVSHRIPIIKECLRELKKYEGREKPIDPDLYRLIRNIGKYIVELEVEQVQPDDIEGIKLNLPSDCRIAENTINEDRLVWYECDKGYFGVKNQYGGRVRLFFQDQYISLNSWPIITTKIPLSHIMLWAEQKGIPYEISTVKPE